jgi:soluble cytochrome b562
MISRFMKDGVPFKTKHARTGPMKIRSYLRNSLRAFPALVLLSAPVAAMAQGGPPGGRPPDSPLHKEMESINKNQRTLSRQIADPEKKASSLELVGAMQKSAETAKTLTPPQAEKLPEAEKTKYMSTFAKDMDSLIKELASLKDAITTDKPDVAKAELDKIMKLKQSSHKELDVKEPRGRGPGGPGKPGGPEKPGNPPNEASAPAPTP